MQSILAYLENVMATYWGQSKYQLLLYIAIIVILLMEKESWKKITFGWYGIICFVGLLNPITVKITSKVWGESTAYYCRQISVIPIFIMVAYGMMVLLRKIDKRNKKLLVTAVLLLIISEGYQIYSESWYTKIQNFNKISNEVVYISEYIDKQGVKTKIAAPVEFSAYIRQYNSKVIQAYGRHATWDYEFEQELKKDMPDVQYIMRQAGQKGCDYVIVANCGETKKAFEKINQEPCFETQSYLMYEISGVERWKYYYDKNNRIRKKSYFNGEGNLEKSIYGCDTIKYTFYKDGNIEQEKYMNGNHTLVKNIYGYYCLKYYYDEKNRTTQIDFMDEKQRLMLNNEGYASISYKYVENSKIVSEHYYNEDREATSLKEGQFGQNIEYDNAGRIIKIEYIDENGQLLNTKKGCAIVQFEYDGSGNKIYEYYYDVEKEPVALVTGEYAKKMTYREDGKLIYTDFLNQDNVLSDTNEGYARIERKYDEKGILIDQIYYKACEIQ